MYNLTVPISSDIVTHLQRHPFLFRHNTIWRCKKRASHCIHFKKALTGCGTNSYGNYIGLYCIMASISEAINLMQNVQNPHPNPNHTYHNLALTETSSLTPNRNPIPTPTTTFRTSDFWSDLPTSDFRNSNLIRTIYSATI